MFTKQRKYQQQPKCLHVITCFLFSSLVLVLEWQTIQATPIMTTATKNGAGVGTPSSSSSSSSTTTRRLRNHHEKPVNSRNSGNGRGGIPPCEHKSLSELIKTSPVILKALGAHIFNHDDDEDLRILHNSNDALLLKWQNEQNKVLTSLRKTQKLQKTSSSSSSSSTKNAEQTKQQHHQEEQQQQQQKPQQQQTFSNAATNRAAMLASMNADAILITLTPETIYKGASLLKMTPNAAEHASHSSGGIQQTTDTSGNSGSSGSSTSSSITSGSTIGSDNNNSANSAGLNSGSINTSEASYLYEGQINATVQPLSCFDETLLKMLPSDLIIFGKLITIQEQQQQQDDFIMAQHDYTASSSSSSQHRQQPPAKDVLKISINGLHRWSAQFESYIWKHLGWDDWSDFTVCSVACGKGVQQRFRRCLLDNPMVNLNMNFNKVDQDEDDDEVDAEMEVVDDDDDNDTLIVDDEINERHNTIDDVDVDDFNGDDANDNDEDKRVGGIVNESVEKTDAVDSVYHQLAESATTTTTTPFLTTPTEVNYHRSSISSSSGNMLVDTDTLITGNMLHFVTTAKSEIILENSTTTTEEPEVMRIFEGHFNDTFSERTSATMPADNGKSFKRFPSSSSSSSSSSFSTSSLLKDKKTIKKSRKQKQNSKKPRKHKSTKLYSTMFCEGYNIEQRNCNNFECSDDINDLLKFYRKYPTNDETNIASTQSMIMDPSSANGVTAGVQYSTMTNEFGGGGGTFTTLTDANNQNSNSFTTPTNMGYIQNWHNSLNFTIMLTIRVKNDSYTTATIFSIRNSTHNLYLESCKDGLRLYLERDKTTEMLPIKFNLYDYHWHQVAISIQNGDFISIYVDCSWTNSFVVSKRLFSLPVEADVEIGRGFNGELQQLLILPKHQERYQCSDKRISINEVKRYIIDTFIDDYSN